MTSTDVEATTGPQPEALQEASVDPLDTPQVNQAAAEFRGVMPKIKTLVKSMSLRQLQRVMVATAEFPLADNYPKFVSKEETELFIMMQHVDGVKGIMKHAVLSNAALLQEIQEKAVNEMVEEIKQTKENE